MTDLALFHVVLHRVDCNQWSNLLILVWTFQVSVETMPHSRYSIPHI